MIISYLKHFKTSAFDKSVQNQNIILVNENLL